MTPKLLLLTLPTLATLPAATIGHWTFNDVGASDGGAIGNVENALNPGTFDGTGINGAVYAAGGPSYTDPVTSTVYSSDFYMNSAGGNDRIQIAPGVLTGNGAFTVEFFMRLGAEPASYHTFARMNNTAGNGGALRRFQVDFDSGVGTYGRARSRFDTSIDGLVATDENRVSRGLMPIFVDTASGSNNPADYAPVSGTFGEQATARQAEGDGINDDTTTWHHIALVFDGGNTFTTYTNGVTEASQTITANSFIMPDGTFEIGKFSGDGYGLDIDGLRISDSALSPDDFLQQNLIPEPSSALLLLLGLIPVVRRRR